MGERRLSTTDSTRPAATRTLLQDPRVEALIVSTPTHVMVKHGLGFDACDVAVIDNYAADCDQIQAIGQGARVTVVLDDLGDCEFAGGLIVNVAPNARPESYSEAVASSARLLLGPAFAPLRAAIRQRRPAVLRNRERRAARAKTMLVTAGGLDGRGLAPIFLRAVLASREAENCNIELVLGGQAASWQAVEDLAVSVPDRIHCHRDMLDIDQLFGDADCSVGPGGITLQEKLCLGLPSLAAVVADNQCGTVEGLAAQGCVLPIDARSHGPEEIFEATRQALDELLEDVTARDAMWRRGAALVDGLGARRVVLAARPEKDCAGRAVTLRRFRVEDAEALLSWQREPRIRRFFRNPAAPDPVAHRAWCEARLADPFGICEIIEANGLPIGLVRVDLNDPLSGEAPREVSILVSGSEQGQGTGTAVLRALRRLLREEAMWADIHPENQASRNSFLRAGFQLTTEDRVEAAALGNTGART